MKNLLFGACFLINMCVGAQDEQTITRDTINLDKAGEALRQLAEENSLFVQRSTLDPKKAATYAAVFPGLGQIYNKHYYKLPIVYGGGMFFIHLVKRNNQLYRAFRNALFNEIDNDQSGYVDVSELKIILKEFKIVLSNEQVEKLVMEVDENKDGTSSVSKVDGMESKICCASSGIRFCREKDVKSG